MASPSALTITIEVEAEKVRCTSAAGGEVQDEFLFEAEGTMVELEEKFRDKYGWRLTAFKTENDVVCEKTDRLDAHSRLCVSRDLSQLKEFLVKCDTSKAEADQFHEITELYYMDFDLFGSRSSESKYIAIPEDINLLESLEELDVCAELTTLPQTIGELKKLKRLRVESGILTTLPETLGELEALEELNLDAPLTALPASIGELRNLKVLNVTKCRCLKTLPESVSKLRSLQKLDCHGCDALFELPTESLGELNELQEIYCSRKVINFQDIQALQEKLHCRIRQPSIDSGDHDSFDFDLFG